LVQQPSAQSSPVLALMAAWSVTVRPQAQPSPRHASSPSRTATAAITSAIDPVTAPAVIAMTVSIRL
jgi:hypothetical protein